MNVAAKKTLGLIGFGQFGRLAAKHLAGCFDLVVADREDSARAIEALGGRFGELEEVAACDYVVVAVPVAAMKPVFSAIAPFVKPGALVMDVASVKVLPAQWMIETLPAHVDVLATHPLFGPQSAKIGLEGLRLVLCPVRGERAHEIKDIAEKAGLIVSITTPEEHDQEMAYVQALTHLIGRSLVKARIPDEDLKTRSYQHLLDLCGLIGEDSFELFSAIQTLNPYAADVARAFVAEAGELLDQVHGPAPRKS